jgi:Protein of unknown function (DUF2927)
MIAAKVPVRCAKLAGLLPIGQVERQERRLVAIQITSLTAARAVAIGAALWLAGCTATPAPEPIDPAHSAQIEQFRHLAFGAPATAAAENRLAKWLRPVHAALVEADTGDREMARQHLNDLAGLTGVVVEEVPAGAAGQASGAPANLLVIFADDPLEAAQRHRRLYGHHVADPRRFDALVAERADSTCFGFLWGGWPTGRGIEFAVVFVRTDRGARTVQGCVVQQTTQVMGLLHDLDPEADSIFSDSGRQVALTQSDRLMLRLLYDPRLKQGMAWAQAEPLARAALRDLKRTTP